jgi:hypothetical protein
MALGRRSRYVERTVADIDRSQPLLTIWRGPTPQATWYASLPDGESIVGRDPRRCSIVLRDDRYVSGRHAAFIVYTRMQSVFVEDRRSTNHTWLDERRVNGREEIHHGDTVVIGETSLLLQLPDAWREDTVPKTWTQPKSRAARGPSDLQHVVAAVRAVDAAIGGTWTGRIRGGPGGLDSLLAEELGVSEDRAGRLADILADRLAIRGRAADRLQRLADLLRSGR